MPDGSDQIYPNGPRITRTLIVGGLTKAELLQELHQNAIAMNEAADTLFASDLFTTSPTPYTVTTVELAVRDLGFAQGAPIAAIYERAQAVGLHLCPLELGPHLRLHYRDQPEGDWGQPVRQHHAPNGSITIASAPLTDDETFPKGFYLRRIQGVLWLRGYWSGPEHSWDADDHFIFRTPDTVT